MLREPALRAPPVGRLVIAMTSRIEQPKRVIGEITRSKIEDK